LELSPGRGKKKKSPCELWKWSGEIGILKGNAVFAVHREAVYVCHKELEQIGIRESKSFNNGEGKERQEGRGGGLLYKYWRLMSMIELISKIKDWRRAGESCV
jgi:hypothetical protein